MKKFLVGNRNGKAVVNWPQAIFFLAVILGTWAVGAVLHRVAIGNPPGMIYWTGMLMFLGTTLGINIYRGLKTPVETLPVLE